MSLRFDLLLPPFDDAFLRRLDELAAHVFEQPSLDVRWRLARMPEASAACAWAELRLVGFKLGYAMTETKYYSWLGGVHADFRRRGVAGELMKTQHAWAAARGFAMVETSADQDNAAMARANLRHGFAVAGLRSEPRRVQVLFLKPLPAPDGAAD